MVLAKVGLSYTTVWQMMRRGEFPRARQVADRSKWLASEVDAWILSRPVQPLKGDEGGS
jgi:predicted DNA-binding transcriptional regulator AlpA